MQPLIFLLSSALYCAVNIRADALNDIDEVCKPNLPNGGKAIICRQKGLSTFNRDPPVYDAAFRNDGQNICCSSGDLCFESRNSDEVACYNPGTKTARTASSSGDCKLVQSERTTKGQQCAFGNGDILDNDDDSLGGVEKVTSIVNGVGQTGVDTASSSSDANPAFAMNAFWIVLGSWTGLSLLAVVM